MLEAEIGVNHEVHAPEGTEIWASELRNGRSYWLHMPEPVVPPKMYYCPRPYSHEMSARMPRGSRAVDEGGELPDPDCQGNTGEMATSIRKHARDRPGAYRQRPRHGRHACIWQPSAFARGNTGGGKQGLVKNMARRAHITHTWVREAAATRIASFEAPAGEPG